MNFDDSLKLLLAELSDLAELCTDVGEHHWTTWANTTAHKLHNHDATALQRLTGAFGGMGSLNDLVIHPVNGHNVSAGDVANVNERLDALRSQIYDRAIELRTELR